MVKRFFYVGLLFVFMFAVQRAFPFSAVSTSYEISLGRPNTHYLEITMHISNIEADSLDVMLPVWRPGRYRLQHYAKNILEFQARTERGQKVSASKVDRSTWRIWNSDHKDIQVKYKYYARKLDAGESYFDDAEAYINPITCLMYLPGQELKSTTLTLNYPADWNAALAADTYQGEFTYFFDNYHELVDTPILISPEFKAFSFSHKGADFDIVLQGEGNYEEEKLIRDVKAIVEEQVNLMDYLPLERFVFLYHLVPFRFRHGVEHKNSTSIVIGPPDFSDTKFYTRFLGVTAHEFFHVWNVERIRPAEIYYPDYSKENHTSTMWMYEGFTEYYSDLTLVRSGLIKPEAYFEEICRKIKSYEGAYGARVVDVAEVSWDSWTKDAGHAPPNTYYSLYDKGALLGLILDLEIRKLTGRKKSLADVMRFLHNEYARQGIGVPENGARAAVEKVAGHDFSVFFEDYIYGTKTINYPRFFEFAGLEFMAKKSEPKPGASLGIRLRGDGKQTVIRNVIPNSPAFEAGLDFEDILLAIDGRKAHKENMDLLLKKYAPGDTVKVTFFRREKLRSLKVVLGEREADSFEIGKLEKATRSQNQLRRDWLNIAD